MRTFSADYLRETRRGMWDDTREALADLSLPTRERVLDVGCGTGELTRVLVEETPGKVVGVDADRDLLAHAADRELSVAGADAHRLPFPDDAFDLVVCQALLINLPDPERAVREFARVSSDLVAAVEPDNGAVTVESTVAAEAALARRARAAYLDGVETDVTLGGAGTATAFRAGGLADVRTRSYARRRVVEPPYSEHALESARKKVSGEGLDASRETMLAGSFSRAAYDELRVAWKAMGRDVVAQMRERSYRRVETVPFYVTVGRV